jgi:hypothetical protein
VISSLPARRTKATRVEEVSAHRFPLFPVDCSTPVPGMSGRTSAGRVWRDSFRAIVELRRVLIGVRWGPGGDGCPDPVPTPVGRPTSPAYGGAGRDTRCSALPRIR